METLVRKRATLKTRLTIFERFLNGLANNSKLTSAENAELSRRVKDINNLLIEFENVQLEINLLNSTGEDLNEDEVDTQWLEFESRFYKAMSLADVLLALQQTSHEPVQDTVSDPRSGRISPALSCSNTVNNLSSVRLPSIKLPCFSGKPEEWISFRDLFKALVDENDNLTSVEKMTYLVSSLKGEGLESIGGLNISSANYSICWQLLLDRYNSSRSLIFFHVKALFELNQQSKESSRGLRTLVDCFQRNKRALESLLDEDNLKETLLMYLLQSRVDPQTSKEFETQISSETAPSLEELVRFIERKASLLETLETRSDRKSQNNYFAPNKPVKGRSFTANVERACILCNGEHFIASCKGFLDLKPTDRWERVKALRLCLNCLNKSHFTRECRSKIICKLCKRRHNSLLHFETKPNGNVSENNSLPETSAQTVSSENLSISTQLNTISHQQGVLLPTAQIVVYDKLGNSHYARALLDSGSTSSFISEGFAKRIHAKVIPANIRISGIALSNSRSYNYCQVVMYSVTTGYQLKTDCIIMPRITSKMPSTPLNIDNLDIPNDLVLADPSFHVPSQIDILIGADHVWSLLKSCQKSLGKNKPTLIESTVGWLISGPIPFVSQRAQSYFCKVNTESNIDTSLTKFWEVEEVPSGKLLTKEEQFCESHFAENTCRDENGRFVVKFPFKEDPSNLGNSLDAAKRRFFALERRLSSNCQFRERYTTFMNEYQSLSHMSEFQSKNIDNLHFLPHHGVLRENSLSTKLRVVFDGSAKTTTGVSLNNLQAVGPTIQSDLFSILVRFRSYTFVFSSDVHKMYRQIIMNEEDRKFQCILWRDSPDLPLKIYQLNTVTYGTSSASFLATRCLKQISLDCNQSNPTLSQIIEHDFYMDDVLSGSNSLEEARNICNDLNKLLASYGFPLRKWLSNAPFILAGLDKSDMHPNLFEFSTSKTLGLSWSNLSDNLVFSIPESKSKEVTKRSILSEISQIFDPLGLVQPCTMKGKCILQNLWLEKLDWDSTPSASIVNEWEEIKMQLPQLNKLTIPRHALCKNPKSVSLHAFADASCKGYGTCVYLRSVSQEGEISCNLLCSKGKVAPLRVVSIPRLELCAAVMLVRLVAQVTSALRIDVQDLTFWTDSTIVLCWLQMHPNKLSTFVANRVSLIQELSGSASWRHVGTHSNPSDIISRGATPAELLQSQLWNYGPSWLLLPDSAWPNSKFDLDEIPEIKNTFSLLADSDDKSVIAFEDYSNLSKLKRVTAYCIRFVNNCRKSATERFTEELSLAEINNAMCVLVRISQLESFSDEIKALSANLSLKHATLRGLDPFLDKNGTLLVGGRLKFSSYAYEKRHPAILSGKHPLAKLIVAQEHKQLLHAGPQQMLSSIRDRYWIISGRKLCKEISRSCITCFRHSPTSIKPKMGNLPSSRVEQSFPFEHTGVDFAGPFLIKDRKTRGSKTSKCYLCLFICLCTKAIHLELVSSLSSEAFLQCLRRFVSRRGKPISITSDNGSNFVGANSLLKDLSRFIKDNKDVISALSVEENIHWNFIPSYSPHFGGIWERAVRSAKHHLRRIVGQTTLTYEELDTLLCQVECILNSRPLTPMSSDPNDLNPLTPGHFLIGRTLTSVPDPNILSVNTNRLSRYQLVQQLSQHFWERWRKEYLQCLQQRHKWQKSTPDLQLNTLVLLKQDHLPPLKWRLGRVIELHPGSDGIVRVASVQTTTGVVRRAVRTLCPLPLTND